MQRRIRRIPPVCLFVALGRLLTGGIRLSDENLGKIVNNDAGGKFRIFRNIKSKKQDIFPDACVFIVSFKFARLSHNTNKVVSLIPMLLIAGFPGFIQKMYAVNDENGYWMGLYKWKSKKHLEAYKKSFVFRMMNKRALPNSLNMTESDKLNIID